MRVNRNAVLNVLTGLLTLAAIGVVWERLRPRPQALAGAPTYVSNSSSFATRGIRLGHGLSRPRVVVFSDFQCPFCSTAMQALRSLQATHPNVVVLYRHYPLAMHPYAHAAAVAAECADAQGAGAAMHDKLFLLQDSIGKVTWQEFGQRAGVPDVERFRRCLGEPLARDAVSADSAAARSLGVNATPTMLIGDSLFSGFGDAELLATRVLGAPDGAKK